MNSNDKNKTQEELNELEIKKIVHEHLQSCLFDKSNLSTFNEYDTQTKDATHSNFPQFDISSVSDAIRASAFAIAGQSSDNISHIPISDPLYNCITRQTSDFKLFQRPAKQQVTIDELQRHAYNQGDESFNIWYGKFATDRNERYNPTPIPASYRCKPLEDAGYTSANYQTDYICIFFARGCCAWGARCTYLHHIPGEFEESRLPAAVDIFGRQRHAFHKDDRQGVGSFLEDCRTLFVSGLGWGEDSETGNIDPSETIAEQIAYAFAEFGLLEDIKIVKRKGIAFVRYKYRVNAEMARESLHAQCIDQSSPVITVRWAFKDQELQEKAPRKKKQVSDFNKSKVNETVTSSMNINQSEDYNAWEQVSYQIAKDEADRNQANMTRILAQIHNQTSK